MDASRREVGGVQAGWVLAWFFGGGEGMTEEKVRKGKREKTYMMTGSNPLSWSKACS